MYKRWANLSKFAQEDAGKRNRKIVRHGAAIRGFVFEIRAVKVYTRDHRYALHVYVYSGQLIVRLHMHLLAHEEHVSVTFTRVKTFHHLYTGNETSDC